MLLLRLAVSTQRSVQLRAVALPLQRRRRQDCRDAVRSLSTSSHLCRGSESDKAASTKDADAATTSSSSLKSSASGVRITDKRTAAAQAAAAAASSKEQQSATRSGSDDAVEPLSNEELLKKRMRMAQQRLENPSYGVAVEAVSSSSSSLSEASLKDAAAAAAAPFFPASTSSLAGANSSLNSTPRLAPQQSAAAHQSTAQADEPSSAASGSSSVEEHHFAAAARAERRGAAVEQGGSSSDAAAGGGEGVTLEQDGVLSTTMTSPSTGALQGSSSSSSSYSRPARITHPFDTHAFVERLLQAGFRNAPVNVDMSLSEDTQLQLGTRNPHDPAEALMQATRHLLITRSEAVLERNLNKTQVENEAYLFSAALSELRTELQVRARSDAAALRSITTLLQREVDGLGQRMNEEINTLKHDIAVDMNNRKGESQQDTNSLEQEIQDLQNRFTLSLGDLRVEIEESIRWGATRRALGLFFGIAIIVVTTLWTADYMTRGYDTKAATEAASQTASEEALSLRPKTSEELGLEEKYNDLAEIETGVRHV